MSRDRQDFKTFAALQIQISAEIAKLFMNMINELPVQYPVSAAFQLNLAIFKPNFDVFKSKFREFLQKLSGNDKYSGKVMKFKKAFLKILIFLQSKIGATIGKL